MDPHYSAYPPRRAVTASLPEDCNHMILERHMDMLRLARRTHQRSAQLILMSGERFLSALQSFCGLMESIPYLDLSAPSATATAHVNFYTSDLTVLQHCTGDKRRLSSVGYYPWVTGYDVVITHNSGDLPA
jgi:hypothetical protein